MRRQTGARPSAFSLVSTDDEQKDRLGNKKVREQGSEEKVCGQVVRSELRWLNTSLAQSEKERGHVVSLSWITQDTLPPTYLATSTPLERFPRLWATWPVSGAGRGWTLTDHGQARAGCHIQTSQANSLCEMLSPSSKPSSAQLSWLTLNSQLPGPAPVYSFLAGLLQRSFRGTPVWCEGVEATAHREAFWTGWGVTWHGLSQTGDRTFWLPPHDSRCILSPSTTRRQRWVL